MTKRRVTRRLLVPTGTLLALACIGVRILAFSASGTSDLSSANVSVFKRAGSADDQLPEQVVDRPSASQLTNIDEARLAQTTPDARLYLVPGEGGALCLVVAWQDSDRDELRLAGIPRQRCHLPRTTCVERHDGCVGDRRGWCAGRRWNTRREQHVRVPRPCERQPHAEVRVGAAPTLHRIAPAAGAVAAFGGQAVVETTI